MKPIILAIVLALGSSTPPQQPRIQVSAPRIIPAIPTLPALAMPVFPHYQPLPLATLPPATLPVAPAGTYANSYDFGNCTTYVASRIKVPDSWGNADTWAAAARAQGITVSDTPIVGAIAQSTGGVWGHVAVVVAVGNGTVTVDEMNVRGLDMVDEATYPVNYFNNYIYI